MPQNAENMLGGKLVEILKTIDSREIAQLEKFILSPFYCTDKKVILLFNILKKAHPHLPSQTLNKSKIYQKIFPGESISEAQKNHYQKLRLLCSYLLKLVHKYFMMCELEQHQHIQDWLLLQGFYYRGIQGEQHRMFAKSMKKISNIRIPASRDYLSMYLVSDFDLIRPRGAFEERDLTTPLQYLDHFFLSDKLKRFCLAMQLNINVNIQELDTFFQQSMLKETMDYFRKSPNKRLMTSMYYYLLATFVAFINGSYKEAQAAYRASKRIREQLILLTKQSKKMEIELKEDLVDLYSLSASICNQFSRTINSIYQYELFDMYQERLNLKLLHVDDWLHHQHYKNLVTLALRTGKIGQAEHFAIGLKDEVHPNYRKDAYAYNLAHVYLFKQEYQNVHKLLSQFRILNPFYNLGARAIRIKAYMEAYISRKENKAEMYEDFERARFNLKRYLQREPNLSDLQKEQYGNFTSFTQRLMRIWEERKGNLEQLEEEIKTCRSVFDKSWLFSMIRYKS